MLINKVLVISLFWGYLISTIFINVFMANNYMKCENLNPRALCNLSETDCQAVSFITLNT